jgi:uncharacterized protein VirK/YbjX
MPLTPIKPNSVLLSIMLAVITNLALVRHLGKDGVRTALNRVGKGARLLIHPRTYLKVARVLASSETRPVVLAEPRLMVKYLSSYLRIDLSDKERAAILIDHYGFLKNRVQEDFFRRIMERRLLLWRHGVGAHQYQIRLTFPLAHDEGDLALLFESDGVDIYTLSFTIGPGRISGLHVDHAIYIGRVQGKGNGLNLIRTATRECMDVSPATLLLASAEAIATALNLEYMVGIGADSHVAANGDARREVLAKAYDEFWVAMGGHRVDRNMYRLNVPLPAKPIQSIKRNHRARVLRRRGFKDCVKEKVRCAFQDIALRKPD